MFKKINAALIYLFTLSFCFAAYATYGGGTGTVQDPYLITSAEDMQDIGTHPTHWASHFKLTADIDLSIYDGHNGKPYFNRIGNDTIKFTGVFDGNDYKIMNFTFDNPLDKTGIFSCVDNINSQIKNIQIVSPNINIPNSPYNVGSLIGLLFNGTISNCSVVGGSVNGYTACGGLIGTNISGNINNCQSNCDVSGTGNVGGLVGQNSGIISNCSADVNVTGRNYSIGGLVGYNNYYTSKIANSHSAGTIQGTDTARNVGGLVGSADQYEIQNSYADAKVIGKQNVGGLIGACNSCTIKNCYSTGDVNGITAIGGLFGSISSSNAESCYASGKIEGQNSVGGLIGTCSWSPLTVKKCFALGDVSGNSRIGGLAGNLAGSEVIISLSFAKGNVSGSSEIGGLVGYNAVKIQNVYSTSNVSGNEKTGGLIGLDEGTVEYSYAAGSVNGTSNIGSLIGYKNTGQYTKCFWNTNINPDLNGIGNTSDPNVIGKSSFEMQNANTFVNAGWNFEGIWDIVKNQTYPYLRTYSSGDINHDNIVNFLDFAQIASNWLLTVEQ